MTQNLLTEDNVFQRHTIRISEHVIKHHKRGRASQTRFTVEMRPCILRKLTNSKNKAIHFLDEWTCVVRDRDAYVMRARTVGNIALCACALDSHPLRRDRIAVGVFDPVPRSNINFAAGLKRPNPSGFLALDLFLTPSDIRPVV
jgi:hypothetical protein